MKFQNIITYQDNWQDYISALFFESEGIMYVIMHKSADASMSLRTVLGRYTDDPWQYAEKVENDSTETDVV